MTQYIDKSALVAEIKRYKHKADERLKIKGRTLAEDLKDSALQNLCGNLIHFLDTLEVKEVNEEPISNDLEEAARKIATRHSHITGDTYYANDAWFFKKGAQWQKEQTIYKACNYLFSHMGLFVTFINDDIVEDIESCEFIKKFRIAMEDNYETSGH